MHRLKAVFKDTCGLHARIDAYLRKSSVLKIGLVPNVARERTASLLSALIDDPIQSTPWSKAVADRPLTKDTVVVQAPSFEFIETHNSRTVYPIPFPGPSLEYLEVNSTIDSWDHLKNCHLHLLLTDRASQPVQGTEYPSLNVIDSSSATARAAIDPQTVTYTGEIVNVNSQLALTANKELQASPSNVSHYLKMRKQSGIDELLATFDHARVFKALKESIIISCESQISDAKSLVRQQIASGSAPATQLRKQWSQHAHEELQASLLPRVRQKLTNDLAFYKLYARTDDVESVFTHVLDTGMPRSESELQFLKGKLSARQSAGTRGGTRGDSLAQSHLTENLRSDTLALQNSAMRAVLTSLFGIQLPLVGLSAAGLLLAQFNWYSMSALALLGLTSGLKKLQNDWISATQKFEQTVRDKAVQSIEQSEQALWEIGESAIQNAENSIAEMEQALSEVDEK